MAELVDRGTDPIVIQKAQNTILYLNANYDSSFSKELPYLRNLRTTHFLRFVVEQLIKHKNRVKEIKFNIETYMRPITAEDLQIDEKICQGLINTDLEYLSYKAPFSTSTRAQLYPTLKISYADFVKIKNKMREVLEI
jgi:hypothetical protein